ncbi:helix-turn-helix domain-containing protein [uncultured Tateyamaria sp.]|uniref:GlxA family transcriptional regulator n=1 Tax=uncultured Tateyamaria sp. TaxID=455651 RepID=UPI00262FA9D8|nr:helix-turn-helix domain-containing protein [uncultured Tateyamaria sp.]
MAKTEILVLQNTNTLSLAAAVDPLRAANRHSRRHAFDWRFATPDARDVVLTSGLTVPAAPVHRVTDCDVLIIVAGFDLQSQATPRLMASLRRLNRSGTRILAIDGGPWIAAKSGILNGHRATTHWEDLTAFSETFPEVHVVNARYVVSDRLWTSGGAAPALDMVLHLIATVHGAGLAQAVAASFIHTHHPDASEPQLRHPPAHRHTRITARAHHLMEAHLDQPLPLPDIAGRLGLSARTLQLHFRRTLGTTAKSHYLGLRLAEAQRLLLHTDTPLQDVALATGFPAVASLTRAYTKTYGTPPSSARTASITGSA